MSEQHRYDPYAAEGASQAQVIQIENGKQTNTIVICAVLATISALGAAWAIYQSSVAERETRMLQYYLLELDARAIRYGIKNDDESIAKKLAKSGEKSKEK